MKTLFPSKKIVIILALFFLLQIMISSIVLYELSLETARDYLHKTTERVKEDISYKNNRWDVSRYIADGVIPDINPLYIITSDGYIIERWKPIHGLLDVSEFNRLVAYTEPQTINTVTDESWRILSKQVISNGRTVAVITVTAYKPELSDIRLVDEQLKDAISSINSGLIVHGDNIDVSRIDARKLPYTITFQVVNRFNRVLIKNDNTTSITRSPTFIDSSYVDNQVNSGEKTVEDTVTHQSYLTLTTAIYDSSHSIIGIIVVGSPIDSFYEFMEKYTFILAAITIMLMGIFLPFTAKIYKETLSRIKKEKRATYTPHTIQFIKKECKLLIDQEVIDIPFASLQYYFCSALFSNLHKRWEVDELLEKFGEEINTESWRKVYDTMVALNKKANQYINDKLFIVKNKTYRINEKYITKIKSTKVA